MLTRTILVLCIGLLATAEASAQAYKWTDEDGVVHYSDRPRPGAEEIDLSQSRPAQSAQERRPAAATTAPTETALPEEAAPFRYESLGIATPGSEETLWNIEGVLNVSLAVSPPLQPGHRVQVYFDGNPRPVSGTSFQLQEVYRGAHNLQAEILDDTDTLMIRSEPIRFYVQQTSVLRQRRP